MSNLVKVVMFKSPKDECFYIARTLLGEGLVDNYFLAHALFPWIQ